MSFQELAPPVAAGVALTAVATSVSSLFAVSRAPFESSTVAAQPACVLMPI